jgi:hypothetical protein
MDIVNNLIDNMPWRMQAVIDAKGGPRKYWWIIIEKLNINDTANDHVNGSNGCQAITFESRNLVIRNRTNFCPPLINHHKEIQPSRALRATAVPPT